MARANYLGPAGLIISFSCLTVIVVFTFLVHSYGSPHVSEVDLDIFGITLTAATLYAFATIVACFHQIGGIFQIPAIAVLSLLAWYESSWFEGIFWIVLPIVGSTLVLLSWSMGVAMPGSGVLAPPGSGIRDERRVSSAKAVKVVAVLVIVTLALLAAFFGAVFTQEVASLQISVMVEGATYGEVDLIIMVDGDILSAEHLEPGTNPEITVMLFSASLHVPSGTHSVLVDITSETQAATNDVVDAHRDVKVLPFSKQTELFPIGVALA